jgi:hypothetical protein
MAKTKTHTEAVSLERTCGKCAHFNPVFSSCYKSGQQTKDYIYACDWFRTLEELKAEREAARLERMKKEENRLNYLLTAVYVSATSTQMLLEYFDAQFADKKAESDWRFKRAQAAGEIVKAAARIRDLYHHNFAADQTRIMTKFGTQPYDAEAYDSHETDARMWTLKMLYDMDRCPHDGVTVDPVLELYKSMPDNGNFADKDYKHFNR